MCGRVLTRPRFLTFAQSHPGLDALLTLSANPARRGRLRPNYPIEVTAYTLWSESQTIPRQFAIARSLRPKLLFPFLDLKAEYATMKEDIRAAVDKVLESQQFIMGPEVKQLEAEIAAFIGSSFALGCASGSDALPARR